MNTPIEKYGYYGYSCYGRSEEKCHNCSYYNWIKINQEWIMQCTSLYGCWKEDYSNCKIF